MKKIHFVSILIIVTLAVFQSHPLFYGKYTWNTGSIESAYIIQARMLFENLPTPRWNPLWYGGHPFKLSYSPGFLYVVDLISIIMGSDVLEAYRRVTALTLILLPLAIYFFMYSLSRSISVGFLSSVFYLSFPSIHRAIYTYPMVQPYPDHVTLIGLYGETPHLLGLTLALITSTLFYNYVVSRRRVFFLITIFMIAFVNLVNLIAAVSLLIIILVIVVLSNRNTFRRFLISYILGLGICIFVYDYEYLQALITYSPLTIKKQALTVPYVALIILVLSTSYALARILRSKLNVEALSVTLLLTSIFLLVVSLNKFANIELLPQAIRYNPEFDISLYGLTASLIPLSFNKLKRRHRFVVVVLLFSTAMYCYIQGLQPAWNILRVGDYEIANSLEKKVADYICNLPGDVFSPRVYATGSIAFWLNLFTDKPQVRGGFDEVSGSINPIWAHITYLINTSPNTTLIIKWLKAFNVKYVIVDLPSTNLPYKDYKHPEKFEDKLNVIKEIDGVKIYEVPLNDSRLFQLLEKTQNIPIINEIHDLDNLDKYLELIERGGCSSHLDYQIVSNSLINVNIKDLRNDCYLLFKVNYDKRWKAYLEKLELEPKMIGPGFIFYDLSGVRGDVEIDIRYVGEDIVDWLFNIISLIFIGVAIVYNLKKIKKM